MRASPPSWGPNKIPEGASSLSIKFKYKVDVSVVSLMQTQQIQEGALNKFRYKKDVSVVSLLVPQQTTENSFGNWL